MSNFVCQSNQGLLWSSLMSYSEFKNIPGSDQITLFQNSVKTVYDLCPRHATGYSLELSKDGLMTANRETVTAILAKCRDTIQSPPLQQQQQLPLPTLIQPYTSTKPTNNEYSSLPKQQQTTYEQRPQIDLKYEPYSGNSNQPTYEQRSQPSPGYEPFGSNLSQQKQQQAPIPSFLADTVYFDRKFKELSDILLSQARLNGGGADDQQKN